MIKPYIRALALGMTVTACGGAVVLGGPKESDPTAAALEDDGMGTMPSGTLTLASKVDLLLMIDNSSSMKDKQELLRKSLPDLLTRLVSPRCVDAAANVLGTSTNGSCAAGRPEFAPVRDLHIGILSSSLGGRGGDLCPDVGHSNDGAHLLQRGGEDGHPVADAASGFLAFGAGAITDPERLRTDLADLVSGVHDDGCGFEAQLESWYRFLVQPDPYASIAVDATNRTDMQGIDATILKQRHDFLRPDSLVAILMLTDEDDASVDPLEIAGQGWAFLANQFPGSPSFRPDGKSTTAPRAASGCASAPGAPACTSCGFAATCAPDDAACQALKQDAICLRSSGYYGPDEDDLNVRFHHMKQRFGVDPQFPITRYTNGLSSAKVPDRSGEHAPLKPYVSGSEPQRLQLPYPRSYLGNNNCSNPLFSMNLPSETGDELCSLAPGPRSRDMVVFGVIAGVPSSLLTAKVLGEAEWTKILGKDPRHFDETGIDPHMVQSTEPRSGLPGTTAPDDADPIHGREWATGGRDLQYACTFPLETPIACKTAGACGDCGPNAVGAAGPLCGAGAEAGFQIRGKAYPGTRQLEVARVLGGRAIVSSLCPTHVTETSPPDPQFGYRSAMAAMGDRMARSLQPAD